MALLERLQILVDANAQGAIREFQKVGASAERDLGKAEDKLDRLGGKLTQFGTAAVAGGAVAAVGLARLATAASDYGEALNKATVIVGDKAVKNLESFAESASKTAGISKTAALDAAAGFAALGKQAGLTGKPLAGFSTQLVQLAGDLASFNNTTVDEALQALKSGLQGETEPLKRFNIFLSDAALKQEYLAITGEKVSGTLTAQQRIVAAQSLIFKQASDAQGDFGRTSDSLANRQRQLQADFENLKTEVGSGLVPIFQAAAGAASSAVDVFKGLPQGAQSAAGGIAGVGAAVAIVGGGVSVAAGQVIKLREAFTVTGQDGERSLTRLGTAARNITIGVGILAALAALDQGLTQATTSAVGLQKAINEIKSARSAEAALQGLIEQTKQADGAWSDLKDVFQSNPLEDVGALVNLDGVTVDLRRVEEALSGAASSNDWQLLEKQISGLKSASVTQAGDDLVSGLTGGPEGVKRLRDIVSQYEGSLTSAQKAQKTAADEAKGGATAQGQFADAIAESGDAAAEAADKTKLFSDAVKRAGDTAGLARVGLDSAAAGAKAYTQAIEDSSFQDDLIDGALKAGDAYKNLNAVIGNLPKNLELSQIALGKTSDEQNKALSSLLSYGDGVQTFIARLIESGQTDAARFFAEVVRQSLEAQGVTQQYQELLGLTPKQIDTAITVSGDAAALERVKLYTQLLGEEIPDDISTQVLAFVDQGKIQEAAFVLSAWRQQQQDAANAQPVTQPVNADTFAATGIMKVFRDTESKKPLTVPVTFSFPQGSIGSLFGLGQKSVQPSFGGVVGGGRDGDPRTPFAKGGFVPGSGNKDTVPAMLTPGEFVVRKDAAERLGPRALSAINAGQVPTTDAGVTINGGITITGATDPVATGRETVRQMRDLAFLGG